jgi:hypothetical protein
VGIINIGKHKTNIFKMTEDNLVNEFLTKIAGLQARIKELEEALREYAKGNNWSRELDMGDSCQYLAYSSIWKDDTQDGGTIARNALAKESE